jgi:plastocyanin
MTISLRRLSAGGAVLATALAVAACGSTDNGTGSSSTSSGGLSVVAKDFSFTPTSVPVSAGQVSVTFDNQGNTQHSLTLDNGSAEVEAAPGKNATLSFTAPASGSLTFHCKFHPTQMKGSFTVGGGGAGAGGSNSSSSTSSGYGY